MSGPDFVCIGAQRSGTSWLFQCFKEHPEIYMPGKELHFFDQHFENGIEWYKGLFKKKAETKIICGEMTPDYLFDNQALERLYQNFPAAKIIVILREPFDRAYSAVGLLKEHGYSTEDSFNDVIRKEKYIVSQSLYFNQLKRLYGLYPSKQIKIYLFEEIKDNPLRLLSDAFKYVGVESSFIPNGYDMKHNVSGLPYTWRFLNLTKIQNYLNSHKIGQQLLKVKRLTVFKILKQRLMAHDSNLKSIHCSAELKLLFEEDVKKTEKLTGLDLSNWYL